MYKDVVYKKGTSLTEVWCEVFNELSQPGITGITNLSISILIDPQYQLENLQTRNILDEKLLEKGYFKCRTTANTIFPPLWNPNRSRDLFYSRYLKLLPTLKRLSTQNHYGLYFERLIQYSPKISDCNQSVNQLEHIINTFKIGNHRQAALQAAIFDPTRDHTNQRQRGFPCLQHVFFSHNGDSRLTVTGIYATQYIFDRAYGNYLGLYYLGKFMAKEMGLTLANVCCFSSRAELGHINKHEAIELLHKLNNAFNINN
ncbi:MAG: hypothetical protein ABSA51_01545 [Anaerolineaceae bacterium]|jgi:thymidylate synthase